MHYTFDFSKNLTILHRSRQMGPIYFVSPVKVFLFGVRLDGLPIPLSVRRDWLILIQNSTHQREDCANSHGPNAVILMIHHSFHNYDYGEKECGIHADNCGDNNFVEKSHFKGLLTDGRH
ncbi:hypothetical protein KUTeg_006064 [Tegillarca granosa]|uniref:Uncharacterized protein n=1 Tax=Tegillarca granosa TaxID=220873 RepID=A0ABQ9FK51_TEGGR|nr:hypothetical protein KUTeg_006064 [Tegillarca granosa]